MRQFAILFVLGTIHLMTTSISSAGEVIQLWSGQPPGEQLNVGPEEDITKPSDRLIAGRKIIKLKNVARPEIHVYLAPEETRNGASVVICPGGGFNILAWDLEGIEVAQWLNKIGVSAIVLKYRVPTSQQNPKWKAPVQDVQRAISLTRHYAKAWGLKSDRVSVLGFSAGGHAAARAALMTQRQYDATDDIDKLSCRPNAGVLIYPAWLVDDEGELLDDLKVSSKTPPMFLIHAFDDRISAMSSISLLAALKKNKVSSELHVFESGGHGYGLRPLKDQPVTHWPKLCENWFKRMGWVEE